MKEVMSMRAKRLGIAAEAEIEITPLSVISS
jgi:hypothetical protein